MAPQQKGFHDDPSEVVFPKSGQPGNESVIVVDSRRNRADKEVVADLGNILLSSRVVPLLQDCSDNTVQLMTALHSVHAFQGRMVVSADSRHF